MSVPSRPSSQTTLLQHTLDVLRRQGIATWCRSVGRHIVRRYLLHRHHVTYRRLHKRWYARQTPKVSIVIPSYNDHRVLQQCLRSLLRTTNPQHVEIVVCDDASTSADHHAFLDSIRHPHVQVIRRPQNGGFAKAANTGILAARPGRDVILLNSDTEAHDGWLEALLYSATHDDQVGIVGAKLLYPDGTIQSAGTFRNPDEPDWFDHYYRFQAATFAPSNAPSYVFATTGACMLVRREVLESIGLFDERYAMAFEDVDFCLRAIEAGFRVLYYPHAILIHHESATRGRGIGLRELSAKRLFWERWRDWFEGRQVRNPSGQTSIIYVLGDPVSPGCERMVVEHVNRLKALGYETEVYAVQKGSERLGLRVPLRTFGDFATLTHELSRRDAIKVATGPTTAEPVWLASLRRGIATYYLADGEAASPSSDYLAQCVALSKYRREFHYLASSPSHARPLRPLGLVPTWISHGVDLDTFHQIPELPRETDIVLIVGGHRDTFELTLQAWKSLAEPRPRLWAFGAEAGLAAGIDRCLEVGSEADLNRLLNLVTAFITNSKADARETEILQAMAAGAPVICIESSPSMDGCVSHENCLVVEPDPDSVAGAIRTVLTDPGLQERLRHAGLETAARCGWDHVIRNLASFYESLDGQYSSTGVRKQKT
jgi:GT2 family glycosyltransferase